MIGIILGLKSFGAYLFKKGGWKIALVVIFSLASLWAGNKGMNLYKELKAYREAKPDTVYRVDHVTTTLHDTTFLRIQGKVIRDTVDLSLLTRAQLEEAAKPFSVSRGVTVTDENEKVGISFDLSLESVPLEHSLRNLSFTNVRSTYPKETVEITRTVIEPYRPHFLDLFVAVDVGGAFGMKGVAGMGRTGVELNLGAVQLSGALGAGSQNHKAYGIWTAGMKVSTK